MEHKKYIIHVDMDAFYASVEQMDNPSLQGKPIMIGGGERGVLATCSYEARAFGVRSAMPTYIAKAKCPNGIFVYPRMSRYMEVSKKITESLKDIAPIIEVASIDEAYIDATGLENIFGTPTDIAKKIKEVIFEASGGLTCSVGIAPIKFLAKIASDENKPNGLFIIDTHEIEPFLAKMPIGKIPGVGKKFLMDLKKIGIYLCSDVIKLPKDFWEKRYGKSGTLLFERASGIDLREVEPYTAKKSESAETTLRENLLDKKELKNFLFAHAERVGTSLRKHNYKGRTISLKVKYADFKQLTRQLSLNKRTNSTETIFQCACQLLDELKLEKPVRLIGLGVSNFENDLPTQLSLLDSVVTANTQEDKRERLDSALDNLRSRYGKQSIVRGRLFKTEVIHKTNSENKPDSDIAHKEDS